MNAGLLRPILRMGMKPWHPMVIALALAAAGLHYYNGVEQEKQEALELTKSNVYKS